MLINQSPIFKLLQAAYTDIEIQDNKINISDLLYKIVSTNNYKMPEHLRDFLGKMKTSPTIEQMELILSDSVRELSKKPCDNCIECKGCCNAFYATIAEKYIITENSFSEKTIFKWRTFVDDVKTKYGEYNFTPIPSNIRKHVVTQNSIFDTYSKQKEKAYATRNIANSLIILKGLSSSTPYLYNGIISNGRFTGGGLFLNWNGLGVVIDPGFGFVENMQKNKIFIDDIDVIIITHFHIDHTNDIRLLDDLNRSINRDIKDFEKLEEYTKYSKYLESKGRKHHKIKWYVDSESAEHLMSHLNPLINEVITIQNNQFNKDIILSKDVYFTPFHTQHVQKNFYDTDGKINSCFKDNTFGIILKLQDEKSNTFVFGYTSDTSFSNDLVDCLKGTNCLVANISGIYEDDYLQLHYKERHLGYAGCKTLLEKVNPDLFIVSEFWNGITDLRFDVCKDLQTKATKKVLPGEIGLQIELQTNNVRCSICGSYINAKQIKVIAPSRQMKEIVFVCNNCTY